MRPVPVIVLLAATLLAPLAHAAPDVPALRHAWNVSPARAAGAGASAAAARGDAPAPAAAPLSVDVGDLAVLEDDGTFVYTDRDGHRLVDVAAVSRAFYRTHGDDYDFLALYEASGPLEWFGSDGALAAAWVVRNDTHGIGLPLFDQGAAFGSAANLQAILTMNSLSRYPADPDQVITSGDVYSAMAVLAHEFGHRWLAYVRVDSAGTPSTALLGRDLQHWGFFADADASFMEGLDWASVRADSFVTTAMVDRFGALDQYLMGLRDRSELPPIVVVNDPLQIEPPGAYGPTTVPAIGVGCLGRATAWTIDELENQNGPRLPAAASSPHHWRVAFVLVVPQGQAPSGADLAKLQAIRTLFPPRLAAATEGRGSVDVSLVPRAGAVRLAHEPLRDTEDTVAPRAVGVRAWIEPGSVPLALDPGSVTLHWRTSTVAPYQAMTLAPVAADSFAAVLPAFPAGTTVQYWLAAASDSAGIAAQLPAAGPAAPFTFTVGPDLEPPVVTHAAVPRQSADRLPLPLLARVRDNLGVAAVWLEWSADGGPLQVTPATAAGADSFVASLAPGVGRGHRIAYRFGARDAATAQNTGWSRAGFDTLRLGHDAYDDFENPPAGWQHFPVLWSGRDAWHLDTDDGSPAGGAAWKCGSTDGGPYPPHVDAALFTPWIYDVVPGTTLAFDERHSLEEADPADAWDGAVVEWQVGSGPWVPVEPLPGYTHQVLGGTPFLDSGRACWSGESPWTTRTLDLSAAAPGPVRVRVRMSSDDYLGFGGLWVDHVHVHWPDDTNVGVAPEAPADAIAFTGPNPTRGPVRLRLALARDARVDWALLDVQGRRVATLWSGPCAAGTRELAGEAPRTLAPGLYFARLAVDGVVRERRRIALVR